MKNKKEIIYSGKGFSLLSEEFKKRGKKVKVDIVKFPETVAIIPVPQKGKIFLIKQFRYPLKKKIWEIPAGKLDIKESPLEGAKRELREETGFLARKWKKLLSLYISPGYSTEYMHLFLAEGVSQGKRKLDEGEAIEKPKEFSLEKLERMVEKGEIRDIKTVLAILLLEKLWRKNSR